MSLSSGTRLGPYEVLSAWARFSERAISVRTVAESAGPVTCAHGLRVIPDAPWAEVGRIDLFVAMGLYRIVNEVRVPKPGG